MQGLYQTQVYAQFPQGMVKAVIDNKQDNQANKTC